MFSFCGCSKPRLLSLRPKSSAQHPVPRSPSDRPKCWSAARLRGGFPPRGCAVRNTRVVFLFVPVAVLPYVHRLFIAHFFPVLLCLFSATELSTWPVSDWYEYHTFRRVSRCDVYRDPCLRPSRWQPSMCLGRNCMMHLLRICIRDYNPFFHAIKFRNQLLNFSLKFSMTHCIQP